MHEIRKVLFIDQDVIEKYTRFSIMGNGFFAM